MTYASLVALYEKALALAGKIASGRLAGVRIALFATALGMVFTTLPNYPRLLWDEEFDREQCSWNAVLDKRDDPFVDLNKVYPAGSHNANMNFRLTVPVIARFAGMGKLGVFAFQSACGVALLWVVARVVLRATGDLVSALFVTCGVASTWAGTTAFIELRGMFDGEALLFLSCAALFEGAWLAGPFAFVAAWSDERALVALSLVYLYHVYRRERRGHDRLASYFGPAPMAIVAGGVAYLVTRLALARFYHMTTNTVMITPRTVIDQINNLPMGCWTALEGGWLLALAAMNVLVRERRIAFLALYVAAISLVLFVSMAVLDITRSMAYALPAIFIAVEVLREVDGIPDLRAICALSSAVSILWPNYYAQMRDQIFWNVPLPVRVLKWYSDARGG
jgi:hypothetical protein